MHKLKQLRKEYDLSIGELSELSGLATSTISKIEKGDSQYRINKTVAAVLAELFDCDIYDIFNDDELSHLGRPALTGRPISTTVTQRLEITIVRDGVTDTVTFTHTREGEICPSCFLQMPLIGRCENCH